LVRMRWDLLALLKKELPHNFCEIMTQKDMRTICLAFSALE
jgi:hypothetical protein